MPIYEYRCTDQNCGAHSEHIQKFSDPPLTLCPTCGEHTLVKQTSLPSFHLKGQGWYKDGYSNSTAKKESTPSDGKAAKATAEQKTADTRPKSKETQPTKESGSGKGSGTSASAAH